MSFFKRSLRLFIPHISKQIEGSGSSKPLSTVLSANFCHFLLLFGSESLLNEIKRIKSVLWMKYCVNKGNHLLSALLSLSFSLQSCFPWRHLKAACVLRKRSLRHQPAGQQRLFMQLKYHRQSVDTRPLWAPNTVHTLQNVVVVQTGSVLAS